MFVLFKFVPTFLAAGAFLAVTFFSLGAALGLGAAFSCACVNITYKKNKNEMYQKKCEFVKFFILFFCFCPYAHSVVVTLM
jgi:hypothetical protein